MTATTISAPPIVIVPEQLIINFTKDDFEGRYSDYEDCPLARVLTRMFPNNGIRLWCAWENDMGDTWIKSIFTSNKVDVIKVFSNNQLTINGKMFEYPDDRWCNESVYNIKVLVDSSRFRSTQMQSSVTSHVNMESAVEWIKEMYGTKTKVLY